MRDLKELLGFRDPFVKLCQLLNRDLEQINQSNEVSLWVLVEARLYLLSYLVEDLHSGDQPLLADMLRIVLQLNIKHIRVRNTIICIIGKAAKYLAQMYTL